MNNCYVKFGTLLLVAALSLGVAGCGDEEVDANDQQNEQENQNSEENNDNHDVEMCADGENPEFASDYDLLFSEFTFLDHSPGESLNGVIAEFMEDEDHPIIVLVELAELDTEAGEVEVRGGAGLETETEGEYRWDDEDEEVDEPDSTLGSIDSNGHLEATLPIFNFVATIPLEEEELKTVLRIRDLQLDAIVQAEDDGANPCISNGDLEGIIWYDDVEDVTISLGDGGVELTRVLGESNMNYDYSGNGEADAWQMEATFSADETVIVE